MDARGTCDGRHRARKHCPDPGCYLLTPAATGEPIEVDREREELRRQIDKDFPDGVPDVTDEDRATLRKLHAAQLAALPNDDGLILGTDGTCELCPHVALCDRGCRRRYPEQYANEADAPHPLAGVTPLPGSAGYDLPWDPKDHGGQGQPSEYEDPQHDPVVLDALPVTPDRPKRGRYQPAVRFAEPQPGDPQWPVFARDNPGRAKEIVRDGALAAAAYLARVDRSIAKAAAAALESGVPIEFGPGIYRWYCTRDGGYQRTTAAHELPPAPAGWRWSSAQVTAVGGRGALQVSAAVVDASEGANAETGPQSLVLEITGRTGYCTGLDVVLFARPVEVRR